MTFAQWVRTWYFWVPVILMVVMVSWLAFMNRKEYVEICPTCQSDKKKVRYSVRYPLGNDHLYTLEPCEDPWHGKYVDPY